MTSEFLYFSLWGFVISTSAFSIFKIQWSFSKSSLLFISHITTLLHEAFTWKVHLENEIHDIVKSQNDSARAKGKYQNENAFEFILIKRSFLFDNFFFIPFLRQYLIQRSLKASFREGKLLQGNCSRLNC